MTAFAPLLLPAFSVVALTVLAILIVRLLVEE